MKSEHGVDAFIDGCPVCLELCCCVNKTVYCNRKNHCYRKCPASKSIDSIAKANMPLWDYRSDAYVGAISNGKNHGSGNLFPSGSVVTSGNSSKGNRNSNISNDNIIRSDGLGSIENLSFSHSRGGDMPKASPLPLSSPNFYYMPSNTIGLSKHGSLDFLAAAVSIVNNDDNGNDDGNYNGTNNNNYYDNNTSQKNDLIDDNTELIRKRLRENKNVRSSSTFQSNRNDRENKLYCSSIKNRSMDSIYIINQNSKDDEDDVSESNRIDNNDSNKAIKTMSNQFESSSRLSLPPPPTYFLASNLLPLRSIKVQSVRNPDLSEQVKEKMKWVGGSLKNLNTTLKGIELSSISKLQTDMNQNKIGDIEKEGGREKGVEIENDTDNENENFSHQEFNNISSNSSSLHRIGSNLHQPSIGYDGDVDIKLFWFADSNDDFNSFEFEF